MKLEQIFCHEKKPLWAMGEKIARKFSSSINKGHSKMYEYITNFKGFLYNFIRCPKIGLFYFPQKVVSLLFMSYWNQFPYSKCVFFFTAFFYSLDENLLDNVSPSLTILMDDLWWVQNTTKWVAFSFFFFEILLTKYDTYDIYTT